MSNNVYQMIARALAEYARCIDDDRLEEWPNHFHGACVYKIKTAANYRDGLEAGRRGQGDRRQTGGRDQRRISSAGRSADDLSRRRSRAGPRYFGRHGRVRSVGTRSAHRRREIRSRDAATEPGPAPAVGRTAAAAPAATDSETNAR